MVLVSAATACEPDILLTEPFILAAGGEAISHSCPHVVWPPIDVEVLPAYILGMTRPIGVSKSLVHLSCHTFPEVWSTLKTASVNDGDDQ